MSVAAGFRANFMKPVVNTLIMTAAGYGILAGMASLPKTLYVDLLRLLSIIGACSIVYLAGAKLMKDEMLSLVVRSRKPKV